MKHKALFVLLMSVCATSFAAVSSKSETVVTKTVTERSLPMGGTTINLDNFDLNKNGILSSFEVGEMLFKLFDTNTSGAIDNKEYEFRSILTVAPMEKTTIVSYDHDNDGITDQTQYTLEKFTQDTQLARFDGNKDGLSPHEFIDKTFAQADSDNSLGIELMEWRNAYMTRITPVQGQ